MSWKSLLRFELKAIFTNPALLFTVFGGIVIYSFLYPLPYSEQLPREQRVAVVNLDHSQLSRKLIRMADATPQVEITEHLSSIYSAQQQLEQSNIDGILVIPENFYRDVLLGKSPTLAYAGNAALFLVYGTVVEGLASAGGTLGAHIKVSHMVMDGHNIALAANQYSAMKLNMRPIFNTTMGYINYVVPAVFVLILHQTLLIGVSIIGGEHNERRAEGEIGYWMTYPAWKIIFVRTILFVLIYIPLTMYYFGWSFDYYDISKLAKVPELLLLTVPFLVSVISLGLVIGQLIPRRELATLIVLLSSLPLVFSAGFIWPTAELPTIIKGFAQLVPSTPAINGFLRLNQMGASFTQVAPYFWQMWLQAVIYFMLAWGLMSRNRSHLE
ncbi:TPA: ABC transporter permease [Photobacterium damselae]